MAEIEGSPRAPREVRVAVLVSRYNEVVTTRLLDGARQCLREKGVELVWGPRVAPTYARAEICDPEGNHIELRQWFK